MTVIKINKVDSQLIENMKKDHSLFNNMVENNAGFIHRIVRSFNIDDRDFREDLVQEGNIALWKAIGKYDTERTDKSSFSTFAYRVIYNDVLQAIKKRNKVNKKETSMEAFTRSYSNDGDEFKEYKENNWKKPYEYDHMEDIVVEKVYREQLESCLSPVEKKIYKWRVEEGLSHKKAAEMCELNFHTYKLIFYTTFRTKMKESGVDVK